LNVPKKNTEYKDTRLPKKKAEIPGESPKGEDRMPRENRP
jgi:hypothetical protein